MVTGDRIEVRPGRALSVAHRAAPSGSPHGGTVLFFAHGGGGNKNQWRYQWDALAADGYELVAWDFTGHGDSPDAPPESGAYRGEETIADYLALFERFKGKRNVLVAHSLGTGSTLALLDRLSRDGRLREIDAALLLGTQLARPQPRAPSLPVWLLEWLKPWFARGFRRLAWHPDASRVLVRYESKVARRNRMATFKAIIEDAPWANPAGLSQLDLPIVVLSGDTDGLTPAEGGRALALALPQARFEVVARCGHQLMLERPDAVSGALQSLLQKVESEVVDSTATLRG
ncbi:alpha/beta fold hydrolase [Paraburkholderia tropica]|uniref:alpha/beta fold hydrolase n=1 Tax=Paraburkholderia tropica TaxID=92647 RepID=UPI001CC3C7FF|nr:alpha/beta hydrolase [Paraburkholderia tropica]